MLWVKMDGQGALHRQLYRALKSAIVEGRLEAGQRLPATRAFAQELGLSRNTVVQAVDQLVAEGYATGRVGSGTYVADVVPHAAIGDDSGTGGPAPRLSAAAQRLARVAAPGRTSFNPWPELLPCDFRYGEPSFAELPLDAWSRLVARRLRRMSARRLSYQAPGGAPELREALSGYLARARGVACAPDDIVVTHGSQQALDLVARVLVDPGDRVVVEDPSYSGLSLCLNAAGADIVAIPVDEDGLRVQDLDPCSDVRLACVTPSHQFPTGAVLSLPRRLALLDWAARRDAWVLEDDYDGEFRYDGRPIESLQSLDRRRRVIYTGTASKLLFPSLRIGWLAAPSALSPHLRDAKAMADTGTSTLEQFVLADFLAEGHLERYVRRARAKMALRRAALLEAVSEHLGDRARVLGADAGLHVLLQFPGLGRDDVRRLRRAGRQAGVAVYPSLPFYRDPPACAELILGYAALTEDTIRDGIRRLRQALDTL